MESILDQEKWGRYTFLGFDPKLEITCRGGVLKAGSLCIRTDDPAAYLRQVLADYKNPQLPGLPTFTGGLVGYFSYAITSVTASRPFAVRLRTARISRTLT